MLIDTSVFSTIFVNSSKLILPSPSRSASMIVLSTICVCCQPFRYHPNPPLHHTSLLGMALQGFPLLAGRTCCNWPSFRLLPTIIFNTTNNSPLLM